MPTISEKAHAYMMGKVSHSRDNQTSEKKTLDEHFDSDGEARVCVVQPIQRLIVGTDCGGLETPIMALKQLKVKLEQQQD